MWMTSGLLEDHSVKNEDFKEVLKEGEVAFAFKASTIKHIANATENSDEPDLILSPSIIPSYITCTKFSFKYDGEFSEDMKGSLQFHSVNLFFIL